MEFEHSHNRHWLYDADDDGQVVTGRDHISGRINRLRSIKVTCDDSGSARPHVCNLLVYPTLKY